MGCIPPVKGFLEGSVCFVANTEYINFDGDDRIQGVPGDAQQLYDIQPDLTIGKYLVADFRLVVLEGKRVAELSPVGAFIKLEHFQVINNNACGLSYFVMLKNNEIYKLEISASSLTDGLNVTSGSLYKTNRVEALEYFLEKESVEPIQTS